MVLDSIEMKQGISGRIGFVAPEKPAKIGTICMCVCVCSTNSNIVALKRRSRCLCHVFAG